ncbi:MAG: DUF5803 family protein [Halolamina sp.]
MRRRSLAVLALVGLVLTSGCLGALTGDGPTDAERLDEPPEEEYAWNPSSDVHITVTKQANFRAVYDVSASGFGDRINLSRTDPLGTKRPLTVRSLRYRYPNGTVINGSEFEAHGGDVYTENNALVVVPPADSGYIAFTGEGTPKRFSLPVYVEGSYILVLPENRRTSVPLFGQIVPEPDEKRVVDGRVNIYWDDLTAPSILVRYYIQRDIQIFGGLAGILTVVALVGLLHYRRRIRELRAQREELGLDVDMDDDGDGPPPGLR